jgi:hypothetical protein
VQSVFDEQASVDDAPAALPFSHHFVIGRRDGVQASLVPQ